MLPLDGGRVVLLGVSISGPLGLHHLADFGVEVIKIEPPGGDRVHHWDSVVGGAGSARRRCGVSARTFSLSTPRATGRPAPTAL